MQLIDLFAGRIARSFHKNYLANLIIKDELIEKPNVKRKCSMLTDSCDGAAVRNDSIRVLKYSSAFY